ncbi:MAG: EAL domain-containing protein [Salaquimonas sp.]|nr:EAL domain-containing protein [Salaquimonas sp.]
MQRFFDARTNTGFAVTRGIPAVVLTLTLCVAIYVLLAWSGTQTDQISYKRQEQLVNLVLSQLRAQTAHDQESSTVWDEALQKAQAHDTSWIDDNLGSWMHSYFGHDEDYVLGPDDAPIYAFTDNDIAEPKVFEAIKPQVEHIIHSLREKMSVGDTSETNDQILSPGSADFAVVRGHPALVSVKPIISDTGDIEQVPGKEYVHIAIRFLDGSLLDELNRDYLFQGPRFSWHNLHGSNEATHPINYADGDTFGYFIWQPYRPGAAVLKQITPVLIGVAVLALGTIIGFMVVVRSRSVKLQASEDRIRHMALHDPLTGLPNRAFFDEYVDQALETASDRCFALLYLDLDRFKQVNDSLGHPAGDELIKEFGARLKSLVRHGDLVARIGGDEFTILFTDVDGNTEVKSLCERIIDLVRKPFDIDGNTVFIGVSVGVTLAPQDGTDRIELLRKSDVALYHSKSTGRGRYAFFDKNMDDEVRTRRDIEQDLRLALRSEGEQLAPYFQPMFSSADNTITGFEALLRWKHPKRGWISPEVFIPIAEEAGLIELIGERVLREACIAAAKWPDVNIAVNVSGIELSNPTYHMLVADALRNSGLKPQRLEIEVTETAATDGLGSAAQNLNAIRDMGVRVAIDDFGTGFSSLGRLQQLKVDRIKIDKSFVHGFGRATDDEAIVQAIIELAHAKGLKTTAEGVETESQSKSLARIGCDDLQGFLFSKALPRKEIDVLFSVDSDADEVNASAA